MLHPIDSKPAPYRSPGPFTSPPAARAPDHTDPLWRSVLERLPSGVAVLDTSGASTLWINPAMEALLREGTGTTQAVGRAPYEYLPSVEADEWEEMLARALDEGKSGQTSAPRRLQFVHYATRNIAYWEWMILPPGSETCSQGIVLTVQSISDRVLNERVLASAGRAADRARRRAETLMRLGEVVNKSLTTPELLRAITHRAAEYFDSSHAAVLLLDPDGDTLTAGYAIGMADASVADPHPLNLNNTVAGRAIAHRETQYVTDLDDASIVTPLLANGQRPAAVVSSPIWQGGRDYGVIEVYFSSLREIADNTQTMLAAFAHQTAIALHRADLYEQLAAHQQHLHSIFENAPVSIVFFDVDGSAVSVNSAAACRYNTPASDMVGRPYTDFLHDLPDELFTRARNGIAFHASHHVRAESGAGQSVCDLSLVPVRDDSGEVNGILLLTFDVTELVQARQEADHARRSAEDTLDQLKATQNQMLQMEKIRAIGELASGVAHDFNNALMSILGYAELAQESLDSPEEVADHLTIIRTAAEDAKTTVKRLQEFAKQRVRAHGEPVDVNAIVKDVIDLTRPRWKDGAQKEGREYRVSMEVLPVPPIMAEPSGLREVLVNLVYNALNAMPDGGELTLSTRLHGDSQVEICVTDTGVGMSQEVAARIFDPFFTTRGVEGTGLGLSVSWTIIQRFGGMIELDTAPGKGTRFMLRFPFADSNTDGSIADCKTSSPETVTGRHALVVDDEPLVASVLTTILTRHGYRVVSAHSAKAALDCLEDEGDDPFDVVLSDHGMPGTTGLQLLAEIKRRRPSLPVVLLTGWGESIMQVQITDVQPDAVLGKPINQADLVDAMARVVVRGENGHTVTKAT